MALEYAEDVASRVDKRPVPVRNGFVERLDPTSTTDAPLAVLLRGGQGGAVRLKLLLALLWFSVRPPHDTDYPARGWAALLGLDEHETNGARRITAALGWLETNNLVRVVHEPGAPSKVYILDERGTGDIYNLPYTALMAKREAGEEENRDDYYLTLPATFFTRGWIAILSAPAVAMLLIMVLEAKYSRRVTKLWHSPSQAKARFGLSQDTRTAGLQELEKYKIVDRETQGVSTKVFDRMRRRNIYDLHVEQLNVGPGQPRPATTVDVTEDDPADAASATAATTTSPPAASPPVRRRRRVDTASHATPTGSPPTPTVKPRRKR